MVVIWSNMAKDEVDPAKRSDSPISYESIVKGIKNGVITFESHWDNLEVIIGDNSFYFYDEPDEDGYGWDDVLKEQKANPDPEFLADKIYDYLEDYGRLGYYQDRYDDWCYFKKCLEAM